ncbi:MAG TPA: TetR family transcriptional regulator [Myxococcaceae bacterium]|nr:TetR family transcriptional regulator [Myxococcaceae bacterium]
MRKSHEERQEDIIRAVIELAAAEDVKDVTTQAIADRVGIAQPTVFRHFPSRDAIFLATINWISQGVFKALEELAANGQPPDERLRRLLERQLQLISRHRGIPRILFSDRLHAEASSLRERMMAVMATYEKHLVGLLTEGRQEGCFREDLEPQEAARMILALIQGLMMRWSLSNFAFPLEQQAETLWRFLWPALAPPHRR